jgi:predicted dinucleotide-binding enzyme
MKTAIVGLGNIGLRLAKNLAANGQSVIISERNLDRAKQLAAELGGNAQVMTIDDAVKASGIVVLAIPFDAIKEFLATYRSALAGKIVVDPSNAVAPDGEGGFKKTIPADQSAGEVIAKLVPEGAKLVKAFGTLTAEAITSAANRSPERAVLFYAADYPDAGHEVAKLIEASGFAPVGVGGIDQSIRIEAFGDLHLFGKLGRLVSVKEAQALV